MKRPLLMTILPACAALAVPAQEKRPAPEDPRREVHVFEVKDLITPKEQDPDKPRTAARNLEALAGFVRTFIDPPLEKEDDVKGLGAGSLVVLARPHQQAWVQRFLARNRKARPYLLNVQATFVHMGKKTFESQLRPLLEKSRSAIIADTEKSAAFMAGLLKKADVKVISAPRYLALPLRQAHVWMGSKIAYVSDYEITETDSPKGHVADPVVEEALDGVLFEGTGAFVDKDFIGLDFKLVIAELHRPIRTELLAERRRNLPDALRKLNPRVSLPETTKTTLKTKALVPDGGWAIFSLGRRHHKHWVLILKVEQIAEPK